MKFKYLASIALMALLASCTPSAPNNTSNRSTNRPTSSSPTPARATQSEANIFGSNLAVENMGNRITPFLASIPKPEPAPEMMMQPRMSRRV
ncbi:hypothetical protein [Pseudanabaena sp. PCC 6802]|uniref:hypothetical protein n=1 Tax=Pseudanabaena sp. PCC 6802 TaxID=118173 RepID=UPI0003498A14|nr:hypothetical protein [Pseudanabaena sp. PCC 6802]